MRVDVVMPQLGESVVEGVVVKWLVKPGDAVAKDQPLVEISTDKVDAEIPSPEAGTVVEILAKEGQVVPIKEVLARIDTEKAAAAPAPPPPKWDEETEGAPGAMARGTAPPIPAAPRAAAPSPPPPAPPPAGEGSGIRVSPVVAKMIAEYGLDISRIAGTGIEGRVTKKDVENYLLRREAKAPPPPLPSVPPPPVPPAAEPHVAPPAAPAPPSVPAKETVTPEGDRVVPWTPIRKKIAEHMVASKRTSPHVHTFAEVDLHKVAAFRAARKREGVSLTYLPFVIRAAVLALREFPTMNAHVAGETTIVKKAIHMGVAVDTDRGLIVPVIRNADTLSIEGIAKAVDDVAARAAARRIMPDELAGGTFSITNPGPKGNLFGTPIINQPQVGILRMGQVVKRPVVIDAGGEDSIVVRPVMILCLAYDHRVVDGVLGNGFLFRVREILEAGEFGP